MPELTVYGTSVFSSANFTTPENALGAPDGLEATTTSSAGILRVRLAGFSALPDTATINRVVIGTRFRPTTSGSSLFVGLLTSAGTVETTKWDLIPLAAANSVTQDFEIERPGAGFTVAGIKNADFRAEFTKESSGAVHAVDAVWVRVVYDESEVTSYATTMFAANGTWSGSANAVGAPNATITASSTAGANLVLRAAGLASAPVDTVIGRVVVGARFRLVSGGTMGLKVSSDTGTVDPAEKVYTATDAFWHQVEYDLDPTKFTLAALRSAAFTITATRGGTGTAQLDAVWARVIPAAAAVSRAKRWDGSQWVSAPLLRWNGSAWIPANLARWDGSAWV